MQVVEGQVEGRLELIVVDGLGSDEVGLCLPELPVAVKNDPHAQLLVVGQTQLEVGWDPDVPLQLHHSQGSVELRDGNVAVAEEEKVVLSELVAELVGHLLPCLPDRHLAVVAEAAGRLKPEAEFCLNREQQGNPLVVVAAHEVDDSLHESVQHLQLGLVLDSLQKVVGLVDVPLEDLDHEEQAVELGRKGLVLAVSEPLIDRYESTAVLSYVGMNVLPL